MTDIKASSSEVYDVDVVVIGAGVIGLAVARAIARAGIEVMVLESEYAIGMGTSSRNSEVIHAGIYYPQDSLKARCCVRGKQLLYEFCDSHQVAYRRSGKLIVASEAAQEGILGDLLLKAQDNGVEDLLWLSQREALMLEPELRVSAALLSPSTGILDTHGYMLALQGDLEAAGGVVVLSSPVLGGYIEEGISGLSAVLSVGGEQPCQLRARQVINSAGLTSSQLLASINDYPQVPPLYWAKGHYFNLVGRSPFSHLVYPVPEPGGLGVHLTLDLGNQARFGPDVSWVDHLNYDVPVGLNAKFKEQIAHYWPAVVSHTLEPAYAGIRPKLSGPGMPAEDFVIETPEQSGVTGWFNLLGIESPGLTASLALAELVVERVLLYR